MKNSSPRIIASIEARMGSSRLPGKVLYDINGKTALDRLYSRLSECKELSGIVLATTDKQNDDQLAEWASENKIEVYRGSENDVLNRVVKAQQYMESDIVVEITGDCILLDPAIIDLGVKTFLSNDCDLVTNCNIPSFPQGIDVQVFSLKNLEYVEKSINDPAVREHVSLYFYENPDKYRILNLLAPQQWERPALRLQLDFAEDLILIRELYKRLEPAWGNSFGLDRIVQELNDNPFLEQINSNCIEKAVR